MAVQDMLNGISDKIGGIANVNTVFGEPRVLNNRAIIPVALVAGGFGVGGNEGSLPPSEGETGEQTFSAGGSGGGFAVRPLAFLEVTDQQTKLIPVLDMTKIILAGMGLLGGMIWAISKSCRARRR